VPGASTSQALVVIDSGGASTYSSGSFKITNNSTSGQRITKIRYNIATALLPDVVFDPDGTAGDPVGKPFTPDSDPGVGIVSHQYLNPLHGGYQVLEITFNNFDPGETLTFSIDIDPTSINGAAQPGPSSSGSVNGFELTGSQVTVDFDNGDSLVAQTYKTPSNTSGSQNIVRSSAPPAPGLEVLGFGGLVGNTTNASQTVRVTGPAGATVSVLVTEAALYLSGVPGGGFDIDPYESNSVIKIKTHSATIGAGGFVDVPISLTRSESEGGHNTVVAVIEDADGRTSELSARAIIDLLDDGNDLLGASLSGIQFGEVSTSSLLSLTLTLTNLGSTGDSSIQITETSISGAAASDFSDDFNDAVGVVLAPGQSVTFNVTFAPSALGERDAILEILHDGTNTPLAILLEGMGI
jgi:hypothetical protein